MVKHVRPGGKGVRPARKGVRRGSGGVRTRLQRVASHYHTRVKLLPIRKTTGYASVVAACPAGAPQVSTLSDLHRKPPHRQAVAI